MLAPSPHCADRGRRSAAAAMAVVAGRLWWGCALFLISSCIFSAIRGATLAAAAKEPSEEAAILHPLDALATLERKEAILAEQTARAEEAKRAMAPLTGDSSGSLDLDKVCGAIEAVWGAGVELLRSLLPSIVYYRAHMTAKRHKHRLGKLFSETVHTMGAAERVPLKAKACPRRPQTGPPISRDALIAEIEWLGACWPQLIPQALLTADGEQQLGRQSIQRVPHRPECLPLTTRRGKQLIQHVTDALVTRIQLIRLRGVALALWREMRIHPRFSMLGSVGAVDSSSLEALWVALDVRLAAIIRLSSCHWQSIRQIKALLAAETEPRFDEDALVLLRDLCRAYYDGGGKDGGDCGDSEFPKMVQERETIAQTRSLKPTCGGREAQEQLLKADRRMACRVHLSGIFHKHLRKHYADTEYGDPADRATRDRIHVAWQDRTERLTTRITQSLFWNEFDESRLETLAPQLGEGIQLVEEIVGEAERFQRYWNAASLVPATLIYNVPSYSHWLLVTIGLYLQQLQSLPADGALLDRTTTDALVIQYGQLRERTIRLTQHLRFQDKSKLPQPVLPLPARKGSHHVTAQVERG